MSARYAKGFTTLSTETTIDALPIAGSLPPWLTGTLLRNGPGKFELEDRDYNHWFDGLAMLHRFTISDGTVSYANRALHSQDYRDSIADGQVSMRGFATDPCMGLFGRLMAAFNPTITDNSNINVVRWADKFIALTESPLAVEFDPITLKTTAHRDFNDHVLRGSATTAHPHTHPHTGDTYNFAVHFGFPRSTYRIYRYDPAKDQRHLLAEVPVSNPAYIHSFGFTPNYAVIAAYPYTVSVPDLAFSGHAFIENYTWDAAGKTRFYVVSLADGSLVHTFEADPVFAFHHINTYEQNDEIIADLATYPDDRAVQGLYLDRIRSGNSPYIPAGDVHRYRLNLSDGTVQCHRVSDALLELPRVSDAHTARPYRYAYGISAESAEVGFPDRLVKIDMDTGEAQNWTADGCYPGEPVFVPSPASAAEDDGVLLSVVLDTNTEQSFMLVLNAANLTEMARATVPHHIPFGFHGQFYDDVQA